MLTGKGVLPDCNRKSPLTGLSLSAEGTCNNIAPRISDPHAYYNLSAITPGFIMSECPFPFIKDPLAKPGTKDTTSTIYCRAGCCIPCPAQNYVSRSTKKNRKQTNNGINFSSILFSSILKGGPCTDLWPLIFFDLYHLLYPSLCLSVI
jgi:hypothetical protein